MNKLAFLTLLLFGSLTAGSLPAADAPDAVKITPVGKWKWFTGPDLSFNIRGEVTGAHRPAVWFWTDEDKHELQIVWGGPVPGLDKVTLSDDGKGLRGSNNDETPVSGARIVDSSAPMAIVPAEPVGTWNWMYGPDLTFHEDGTVTGENRTARWSWVDRDKRQLKVDYGGDFSNIRDTLTLSGDNSHLQGINNQGTEVTGDRIGAAATASSTTHPTTPASTKAPGPAGTWTWFVGPDLTFGADGNISGTNRSAHWNWTDEGKRQLRVQWTGVQYGCIDLLTLSEDGNSLQGANNFETPVSGNRIAAAGSENR